MASAKQTYVYVTGVQHCQCNDHIKSKQRVLAFPLLCKVRLQETRDSANVDHHRSLQPTTHKTHFSAQATSKMALLTSVNYQ